MTFKHRIEYAIVRAGFALGGLFPWNCISDFGAVLGRFIYHVLRVRRRVVLRNLKLAFGDELTERERRRIAGRSYAQAGRSYAEIFALPTLRRRRVLSRIDFEGLEHLEEARAAGKGILFLAAHFGNPELTAISVLELGIPVHLLVGDLSNRAVDRAMNELRGKLGFIIERRRMGLRAVFKLLRGGGGVGFQGDQEARRHGLKVPFFGIVSLTHPGPASISLRTGAPIVPSYQVREGRRFRMVFEAPIWPEGEATDENVLALTARHTAWLESVIRRYPEQWFWLHRRWKRAPRDEAGRPRRVEDGA